MHCYSRSCFKILSKPNKYTITASQPTIFRSNTLPVVNPAQPPGGPYALAVGSMTICCVDYSNMRSLPTADTMAALAQMIGGMTAFPNPWNNQHQLAIRYRFMHNAPVTLQLFDISGRCMATWHPEFDDNTLECFYPVTMQLKPGIYLLKGTNGLELLNAKLVVQ